MKSLGFIIFSRTTTVAVLMLMPEFLTGCGKSRPSPPLQTESNVDRVDAPAFKGETYRSFDEKTFLTLISPDQCELREDNEILLCQYSRQPDALRVVVTKGGTNFVLYFSLVPDGIQSNQGPVLMSTKAYADAVESIRVRDQQLQIRKQNELQLRLRGPVVAWGSNKYGQTNVPKGLRGIAAIAAGENHTVALKDDGTVIAWGANTLGQTNVPAGLRDVVAISAGRLHTVALKRDGSIVAWGSNTNGQSNLPNGLRDFKAVAAGRDHTLALKNSGIVVAWGAWWGSSQYEQALPPANLSGVKAIAAGSEHSIALRNDGTVVAWGKDAFGQTTVPKGLSDVTSIAAGSRHSVALNSIGNVVAWGEFDGGWVKAAYPHPPEGLDSVTAIAAGFGHSVALRGDGTVAAWGFNDNGETDVPDDLRNVTAVSAGWSHTVALVKQEGSAPKSQSNPTIKTTISHVGLPINLSGTWIQYARNEDSWDELGKFFLSRNSEGTWTMESKSSASGTISPIQITEIEAFGDTWQFNSDWGEHGVAEFTLTRSSENEFHGWAHLKNQRVSENKWVRITTEYKPATPPTTSASDEKEKAPPFLESTLTYSTQNLNWAFYFGGGNEGDSLLAIRPIEGRVGDSLNGRPSYKVMLLDDEEWQITINWNAAKDNTSKMRFWVTEGNSDSATLSAVGNVYDSKGTPTLLNGNRAMKFFFKRGNHVPEN